MAKELKLGKNKKSKGEKEDKKSKGGDKKAKKTKKVKAAVSAEPIKRLLVEQTENGYYVEMTVGDNEPTKYVEHTMRRVMNRMREALKSEE